MDWGKFLEQWTVSTFYPPLWNALATENEQRNTAEMEFVKEVIVDVNTRLLKLEQIVDQEYMGTDDFKNFFHKTLLKASIDLRREKMRLLNDYPSRLLSSRASTKNLKKTCTTNTTHTSLRIITTRHCTSV